MWLWVALGQGTLSWSKCCDYCVELLQYMMQVTHRLEELQWADTASYMDEGRIQFSGPAKDVAGYMRRLGART